MSVFRRETANEHSGTNNSGSKVQSGDSNNDDRAWVTETGRGEGCQRCYSQIDLCRILGHNGRVVTVCDDCRSIYMNGGRA